MITLDPCASGATYDKELISSNRNNIPEDRINIFRIDYLATVTSLSFGLMIFSFNRVFDELVRMIEG